MTPKQKLQLDKLDCFKNISQKFKKSSLFEFLEIRKTGRQKVKVLILISCNFLISQCVFWLSSKEVCTTYDMVSSRDKKFLIAFCGLFFPLATTSLTCHEKSGETKSDKMIMLQEKKGHYFPFIKSLSLSTYRVWSNVVWPDW